MLLVKKLSIVYLICVYVYIEIKNAPRNKLNIRLCYNYTQASIDVIYRETIYLFYLVILYV